MLYEDIKLGLANIIKILCRLEATEKLRRKRRSPHLLGCPVIKGKFSYNHPSKMLCLI